MIAMWSAGAVGGTVGLVIIGLLLLSVAWTRIVHDGWRPGNGR